MMQAAPSAGEVIWSFTLLFLIIFVIRALLCWYLKINIVIRLLVEIKVLLGGKEAAGDGHFTALKYLINGGILYSLASKELTAAFRQFETKNNIPATAGAFNVVFNQ